MLINLVRLGMMEKAEKLAKSLNGYLNIYKSHMMTAVRALDFFNNVAAAPSLKIGRQVLSSLSIYLRPLRSVDIKVS